jgi:putative hydrolase of the HAD superfamily
VVGDLPADPRADLPTDLRAVLLDGLGTLLSLVPPAPALAAALRRHHGIELTPAQAQGAFRAEIAYYRAHHCDGRDRGGLLDLRRRCAQVLHAALPPTAAARIQVDRLMGLMLDALRFEAYPDALGALTLLRERRLATVLVSNWDVSLHDVLPLVGLAGMLDRVIVSAEIGRPKPAPEIFHAALESVGVTAAQAIHVGDSPEQDVAGARAAGIAPVLLRRGDPAAHICGSLSAAVPTVPVITSLAELPGLV